MEATPQLPGTTGTKPELSLETSMVTPNSAMLTNSPLVTITPPANTDPVDNPSQLLLAPSHAKTELTMLTIRRRAHPFTVFLPKLLRSRLRS